MSSTAKPATKPAAELAPETAALSGQPVVVCTQHRGVFFGYTDDLLAEPIVLRGARMALYWSSKTGGVQGLAAKGPTDAVTGDGARGSRIGEASDAVLRDVTAVFPCTPEAVAAWQAAPTYRE